MIKPIWAVVGGAAVLGAAGGIGFLFASSGGEEEAAVQNQQTVAATASPSPAPSPTDTASPFPAPSPEPIPEDWQTYVDPEGRFSLRYPPRWYMEPGGSLYSWNYTERSRPFYPADGIAVQVIVGSIDQAEERPADATDSMLGGEAGWEIIREHEPTQAEGSVGEHVVAADRAGMRFFLVGSFGPSADMGMFSFIVSSFRFNK